MQVERDISAVVWIGCLALLFLALAIHEGWFSSTTSPIVTSGTENATNPGGLSAQTAQPDATAGFGIDDLFLWKFPWNG